MSVDATEYAVWRRAELRAKQGQKEGAGGHLQHFGAHGKYARGAGDANDAIATTLPAGTVLYRSAQEPSLHISEMGESGPGAYLTDDPRVAEGYLKAKQEFAPHAQFRAYRTTTDLRLLDRTTPEGEERFRELQRDPTTFKLLKGQAGIARYYAAGYDGIVYPGATGTEREVVIHDPTKLELVESELRARVLELRELVGGHKKGAGGKAQIYGVAGKYAKDYGWIADDGGVNFNSMGATWRDPVKLAAAKETFDALPEDAVITLYHGTTPERAAEIVESGVVAVPAGFVSELHSLAPQSMYVAPTVADAARYGDAVVTFEVRKADLSPSPETLAVEQHDTTKGSSTLARSLFSSFDGAVLNPGQQLGRVNIVGAKPAPPVNLVKELVDNEGFTLNPRTGTLVKQGIAVAIEGHTGIMKASEFMDGDKGRAFVRDYVHKMAAAKPGDGVMVGGWYDREHDEVVLDWSEVFTDRAAGIEAGRRRNQMAVYDLGQNEEIPTGGTGDREAILAEQRARAVGRHEAEQATGRYDPRRAGPLRRPAVGVDDGQPRKAQVTARLLELRGGLKKGGGGQQQVFAGHGKYGTAYDLAVARAEAAKQRKTAAAPSSFKDVATSAKGKLDELVAAAAARLAEAEKLKASSTGQVFTQEELAAALATPIRRRLEQDAVGQLSPEEDVAAGDIAAALRRAESASLLLTPKEEHLLGLYNGDPKALGTLAEAKAYEIGAPISSDPATIKTINDTIADLRTNARYQAAVARYGAIPVVPVKSDQSWDGLYVTDAIAVSDLKFTGGFTKPFEVTSSTPHPLATAPWNVDPSMNGVLRHEYGHHVESLLTLQQHRAWLNAHSAWGEGSLGIGQVRGEWEAHQLRPKSNPRPDQGLSVYGRTNEAEAFAETFALVTHPDYDRSKVHPAAAPMVDAMEKLIGPASATEQRKALGLKKGGGGQQQVFAGHGKYGTAFDLAVARAEAAKQRIAPVSGATVKQVVAVDLTMSVLPEAVQEKATAQMLQSLGVDFETGVEHLVAMAESANARGLPGKDWYPLARAAAVDSAKRNGVDPQVGIAVVAAMSPGTKWEENLRNADAMMSMHKQWDQPIDPQHIAAVNAWGAKEDKTTKAPNSTFTVEAGQTLGQLYKKDPHLASVYAAKKIGASVGYSYDNFFKAMDLVATNDSALIDRTLNGAKVRSFYNNISEPSSTAGDVTIDVHMQRAIANDLASTTPEQKHERMVSVAKRSSSITGSPSYAGASLGAMPLMADVTREATRRFNERHGTKLVPAEFQAVVWTEQITQFTPSTVEAILKAPVP